MVDHAKRHSLKKAASLGVGAIAATSTAAAVSSVADSVSSAETLSSYNTGSLSEFQISSAVSPTKNDLEIIITNSGKTPARITDVSPAVINTPRGKFELKAQLINKTREIGAGESIRVPMQHDVVALNGASIHKRTQLLSDALKQGVSITTDNQSLASVTFKSQTRFA